MSNLHELMEMAPTLAIMDSFAITNGKINNPCYENIMCSISGGADSDVMLDILTKLDKDKKVQYVFFDTGLEYQATIDHLKYIEDKYGIEIQVEKAVKPIPTSCREYGQPFLSKQVSEWIYRLQKHGFKWEDKPFEELIIEYPKCKAALKWWCNKYEKKKDGSESSYNIAHNKWLKEFMIANPPSLMISNKCCTYAKKRVAENYKKQNSIELSLVGIRKAEGGARATAYKSCFSTNEDSTDEFRPIFWYKNEDKSGYADTYDITHSKCYTEYGLTRTGCAGCPFGRNFELELEIIRQYEPKLYKAVNKIFGDSYEYTRKYREFAKRMNEEQGGIII